MKVMVFGYQKLLEIKNFWNFSGQLSRFNIFQVNSFFSPGFWFKIFHSDFPPPYFSLVFNFEKLFFACFRFWKIIFHTNFPATIFSRHARFFHTFSDLEFSASKFRLQFFKIFSVVHFIFYLFFKQIFRQERREGNANEVVASGPRILGAPHLSKKN